MNSKDLERQNQLADALVQKLERIKALWDELPTEDTLTEMAKDAGAIAQSLSMARDTYLSDDFPNADGMEALASTTLPPR